MQAINKKTIPIKIIDLSLNRIVGGSSGGEGCLLVSCMKFSFVPHLLLSEWANTMLNLIFSSFFIFQL